jgi:hypothetical protein
MRSLGVSPLFFVLIEHLCNEWHERYDCFDRKLWRSVCVLPEVSRR